MFNIFQTLIFICFSGFMYFGINRFVGEAEDIKPTNYESEEDYLDVHDVEEEEEEKLPLKMSIPPPSPSLLISQCCPYLQEKHQIRRRENSPRGEIVQKGTNNSPPMGKMWQWRKMRWILQNSLPRWKNKT
jgi:hypothetical protein